MSSPTSKTPESYLVGLRRKDSKNALTTCRGVTDRGRACRRALASPKNSSRDDGAVVITDNDDDPAVFFCRQHKAQAKHLYADEGSVVSIQGRHSLEEVFRNLGLEDVDEEAEASPSPLARASRNDIGIPEPTQTVAHDFAAGPRLERTTPRRKRSHGHRRGAEAEPESASKSRPSRRRPIEESRPVKSGSFFSSLIMCCFSDEPVTKNGRERSDRERERLSAPKPVTVDSRRFEIGHTSRLRPSREHELPHMDYRTSNPAVTLAGQQILAETPSPRIRRQGSDRRHDSGAEPSDQKRKHRRRPSGAHHRASQNGNLDIPSRTRTDFQVYNDTTPSKPPRQPYINASFSHSDTSPLLTDQRPSILHSKSTPDPQQLGRVHGEWLPALPRQASDSTRICYAKLLTAMSEPPSKTDAPGYIYIFWQTEVQQTDDETSAVASIISAPASQGLKRQETILQRRFFDTSSNARLAPVSVNDAEKTLFLKIGRATNVHQRLTQWRKQCEYDLSLLRSYPYERRRGEPRPVPNVVKVERLIHLHLEMLGMRVRKSCRCGTEHKEWFEVGANAGSVREVDEIVRGWVRWSEERFGL